MQNSGICYSLWMQYDAVIIAAIRKMKSLHTECLLCYLSVINAIIVQGPCVKNA